MAIEDEGFFCAKCPKCRARNHEELLQFGQYGNNKHKVKDTNWYCEGHFDELDEEYDDLIGELEPEVDQPIIQSPEDAVEDVVISNPLTFLESLALDRAID